MDHDGVDSESESESESDGLDDASCKSTHYLSDLVCVLVTTTISYGNERLYQSWSLEGLTDKAKKA